MTILKGASVAWVLASVAPYFFRSLPKSSRPPSIALPVWPRTDTASCGGMLKFSVAGSQRTCCKGGVTRGGVISALSTRRVPLPSALTRIRSLGETLWKETGRPCHLAPASLTLDSARIRPEAGSSTTSFAVPENVLLLISTLACRFMPGCTSISWDTIAGAVSDGARARA